MYPGKYKAIRALGSLLKTSNSKVLERILGNVF